MSQLMLRTVEAMFEYLDKLEQALGPVHASDSALRARLGLPRYRFLDRSCPSGSLSCGAQARFVFLGTEEGKKRAAAVDLQPGSIPTATVDDPDACRRKGLCFPNLVRLEFTLCNQDLVLTRNAAPYGRHHGVVRSAAHEPQSRCFEPFRLAAALSVAQQLGSETGASDYEVWVAGEGFNTQWHYHVQFRKQRGPIWTFIDRLERGGQNARFVGGYPSRPLYLHSRDRDQLRDALHEELSKDVPVTRSNEPPEPGPVRPARGLLISYEDARWRVVLVRSWYPTGERLFGKQPGLHEHLGEVIVESEQEFQRVEGDPGAATRLLEERLRKWSERT